MSDYKSTIRPDIREALDRYASYGVPVGGFLTAVLSNDLMDAIGRADDYNRLTIAEICRYVCNELPTRCRGSREAVKKWIESKRQAEVEQ